MSGAKASQTGWSLESQDDADSPRAIETVLPGKLAPSDLGLADGGTQRRVAGLRREEVAQLASISTDYYTRLEQGRISPSAPVLASLARVLRLDDDQRTYMYEVAGTNAASAKSRRRAPQKVKPHMQRVLDHIT